MAMNTKMKPPEGERRRELLVAALAEAVDRMLQLGRSPDEIRSRRLEDTMQLLFELEPQALAARQTSVDAALRTPTIRPAERPLEGAPYQRVFEVIERARRETPEAEAQAVTERTFRDIRTFRGYLRGAELNERVKLERQGVPSLVVKDFISRSGVTARTIQEAAGIPKATFTKKLRGKTLIGGTAAHSLMGMFDLVNAIEDMVRRDPAAGAESFNAEEWVGEWIQKPIPALGGQRPADLWDTPAGREAVLRVVGAAREGVFL